MSLREILASEGLGASTPPPSDVLIFAKVVAKTTGKGGATLRKESLRWVIDLPGWPNASAARINRILAPKVQGLGTLVDADNTLYDVGGTMVMILPFGVGSPPLDSDLAL